MFNDKYGLTKAVLKGRKTQTRRIVHFGDVDDVYAKKDLFPICNNRVEPCLIEKYSNYKVGEIVAIAQSYKDAGYSPDNIFYRSIHKIDGYKKETACSQKGWNNKMFVAPNLMPHQIRITNVRIERLQDIRDEDCLAEGIEFDGKAQSFYCGFNDSTNSKIWLESTPREAYAALINKVSGKGTWESNPYVFVYDFKLVK